MAKKYLTDEERKEAKREAQRRYRESGKKKHPTKEYGREQSFKHRYGITIDDFNSMNDFQNGKCAICGNSETAKKGYLSVDHCHTSNKIRGLLCHYCNSMIGFARDNTHTLFKAIEYLNKEGVNYA